MSEQDQSLKARREFKHRIFRHLNADSRTNGFLALLIVINLTAVVLETVQELRDSYAVVFVGIEIVSIAVFSVECLTRVWTCTDSEEFRRPILGRIRYALTPLAIFDLMSIAPFYMPLVIPFDLRVLRSLRLLRIIRVLKLGRHSRAMRVVYRAVHQTRDELAVVLVVVTILMLMACSAMYHFENVAQPDKFSSIPATLYWGVMTLTTVGYGDVYPVTAGGKFTAGIVAFLGVGLFALPAGIVTAAFVQMIGKDDGRKLCPHCGRIID